MKETCLSIIVPVYNMAPTLGRALDSILMQVADFNYEVIVVDDASTDGTREVCMEYEHRFKHFVYIRNEENSGNAYTFHAGLCAASGKYFCVLDGDDFYALPDKLQRQVAFLNEDVHERYIAVGHYFIHYFDNGNVYINRDFFGEDEYDYLAFLAGEARYCHTSAMMYRNIFQPVPDFFQRDEFRGDTPRTFFALYFSNKKVKILDFVGSVYYQNASGIWSGMSNKHQLRRTLLFSKAFFKLFSSRIERELFAATLKRRIHMANEGGVAKNQCTQDQLLQFVEEKCALFMQSALQGMARKVYASSYYDSLCACVGYVQCLEQGIGRVPALPERRAMVVDGSLKQHPDAPGLVRHIIMTEPECAWTLVEVGDADVGGPVLAAVQGMARVAQVTVPERDVARLFSAVAAVRAARVFVIPGGSSALVNTLAQGGGEWVCVLPRYSVFSLGLRNTNYTSYIVGDSQLCRALGGNTGKATCLPRELAGVPVAQPPRPDGGAWDAAWQADIANISDIYSRLFDVEATIEAIKAADARGDVRGALTICEDNMLQFHDKIYFRFQYCHLLRKYDLDRALMESRALLRDFPASTGGLWQLYHTYYARRENVLAVEQLLALLQVRSEIGNRARILGYLDKVCGFLAQKPDQLPAAINLYQRAVDILPRHLGLRLCLCAFLEQVGEPALALSVAEGAVAVFPRAVAAWVRLMQLAARAGDTGKAAAAARRALLLKPGEENAQAFLRGVDASEGA